MQSIRQTVLLEMTEPSSPTTTASFLDRESRHFPAATPGQAGSQGRIRHDPTVALPSAAEEWDVKAAAIVIGLTAFFVTFLFGLVTEIVSGLIPLGILSATCAASLCLLARSWMLNRLHQHSHSHGEIEE